MSETDLKDAEKQEFDDTSKHQVDCGNPMDNLKDSDKNEENRMPSPQQEEEVIKKKYGGILPKKAPLISKDHERAYFDSADWALGKQGAQKPKGPLEALHPNGHQPTPHQQVRSRRSAYAPTDDEVDGGNSASLEDQSAAEDVGHNNNNTAQY